MGVDVGTATGYLDLDIKGFLAGLQTAGSEAKKAQQDLSSTLGDGLTTIGGKISAAGTMMSAAVTAPIVALGASSVKTAATFESSMSQVQATMGITGDAMSNLNGKSVNTKQALTELAQKMGIETKFSAVEAADAINILAMAGYDTEKIYGSLPNILNLAAAGGLGIAESADIATGVMAGFNLKAEDSAMVADKIAMMASSAKGSVSDFGQAMASAAGQASVTGQSFDDTAVALEILGNHNLSAAEGGNALNRVLKNLYQPTDAAKEVLDAFAISAYDADGNARRLPDVLMELKGKLGGLSEEQYNDVLGKIFDAATLKSVPFLINDCTAAWDTADDSVTSLYEGILGASDAYGGIGAASGQAATQLDNLDGQLTLLSSAWEGIRIQLGNIIMPYFKQFVTKVQELATWFANLSPEQQQQVVKFAAIAAAIGPVLLAFGKVVTGAGNMIKGFKEVSGAISNIKTGFTLLSGGVSAPVLAIVAIIGVLVAAFATLWKTNEDFRNKMTAIWDGIKEKFAGFFEAVNSRMEGLKQAFTNIVNFLKPLWMGFCELLAPIFEGVFQQISNILGAVLDVIVGILDIFIGIFTGNWEQAWNGVKEIFGAIWEFIKATFENWCNVFKGLADTVLGWFGTNWDTVWTNIKTFFVNIWNGIATFFTTVGEAIKNVALTIWNAIYTTVSTILTNIKTFVSTIWNAIYGAIKTVVTTIWNTIKTIWNNILYAITLTIVAIQNVIQNIFGAIKDFLSGNTEAAKEKLRTAWTTIKNFITEIVNVIRSTISAVFEAIKTIITTIINAISTVISTVWNGIKTTVSNVVNGIKTTVSTVFEAMKTAVTNTVNALKTTITNVFDGIKTAMSDAVEKAKANVKQKMQDAKDAVINVWNGIKDTFAGIGKNIIQGIIDGIGGMLSSLYDSIKKGLSGLVDKAKDALGIKSPSRVMRDQIGKWLPLGIAAGFESTMGRASKEMQSSLEDGMSELDAGVVSVGVQADMMTAAGIVADYFESIEARLIIAVASMRASLEYLMMVGMAAANGASLGYIGYGGVVRSATSDKPKDDAPKSSGGGDTFVFYTTKAIDEIEAARQMRKTQRDLAEGFA